jgi:nucleoside-diphosphate-sugar epimerase
MRAVITGGGGFLGQSVARALIARGGLAAEPGAATQLDELVLLDQAYTDAWLNDSRAQYIAGDILDREVVARACAKADAVFHLASVVSAGAEADFDLGMRVNLDGMRNVLEACRSQAAAPRFVFTSSVAAFGGELPEIGGGHARYRRIENRPRDRSRRAVDGQRVGRADRARAQVRQFRLG